VELKRLPNFVTHSLGALMNTKLILAALAVSVSLSLAACKKEEAATPESTEAAAPAEAPPADAAAPAEAPPADQPADAAAAPGEAATAAGEAAQEQPPKQ
jgi:hypothetical protein